VRGDVDSPAGFGVAGFATATTGSNFAGYFQTSSTSGYGVYGHATATTGQPCGVYGEAALGNGIYAVFADGHFASNGNKSFRIDHPLDPKNKYLLHYCTESPYPQNFYNGNVTTDATGYAWVELPEYFSEINANFKYVLTVIDDSDDFVLAKVTKEITHNSFQIRTSKPGVKVSWRVDADRNDLLNRHERATDVTEKAGSEKGKYQRPELYGLGPEMGMHYNATREHAQLQPPSLPTASPAPR
jgi:hypothetical protein